MRLVKKIIFGASIAIICGLLFFLNFSCAIGHPFPRTDELYEIRDPNTNEPVFQIVATKWTDGHYSTPVVRFLDSKGYTWVVGFYSDDPNMWSVRRISNGERKEVGFQKIFTSPTGAPMWLPDSEFNDYKKEIELRQRLLQNR
jgi:hypothetical protein